MKSEGSRENEPPFKYKLLIGWLEDALIYMLARDYDECAYAHSEFDIEFAFYRDGEFMEKRCGAELVSSVQWLRYASWHHP